MCNNFLPRAKRPALPAGLALGTPCPHQTPQGLMPYGQAQPPILGYAAAAVCPAVPAQGHHPLLPAVVWSWAPGCLPRRPAGRCGLGDLEAPDGGEFSYAVYSPSRPA